MKNFLLSVALLLGTSVNSQNLNNAASSDEAINKAVDLVSNTNNLKYTASKLFNDENKFLVKFENGKDELLFEFNYIKNEASEEYVFIRASGNYENITAIWQNKFSKEKKNQYLDSQNKLSYQYYSEDYDEKWIISR